MISWLFLSFIFGYVASIDSFNEYLTTKPLQDGRVDVGFNFTITDSEICEWIFTLRHLWGNIVASHTNLFPLPLVSLLRSPEIDIDELHLSLSAGIWDYSKWNYPHFPQLGSSGIELWVSHNSDRYVRVINVIKLISIKYTSKMEQIGAYSFRNVLRIIQHFW